MTTLAGVWRLTLKIRRCPNRACPRYHQAYRPEEEGGWALPQSEFGLDVIVLVGTLRYREQRRVPQLHQALRERGVGMALRTVRNLLSRYEELIALRVQDHPERLERLRRQKRVVLGIDGLQPDVGQEVLWVLRDCLSGEIVLARSLLSSTAEDLAAWLREAQQHLPVAITGVVSDGQESIRLAVPDALPGVPHQLCPFHYLREAAQPIFEADRHAKKELKKCVRPIERALEGQETAEAEAVRGYCLALRSALTDDGRPPLDASGLTLQGRLEGITTSIERVAAKRGSPVN